MKRVASVVLALALVLGFSLAATTPVAAETIDVPDDYSTIQLAVDNAGSGDTIMVAAGTYDAFTVEGRSNITIIGEDGVTVDSANNFTDGGEWWVMALVMNSTNINIENIVFDGEGIDVNILEGVTYADSTGSITGGAVRNIIGSEMAMGIAISGGEEGSTAVDISHLTVESCSMGVVVRNAEVSLDMCSIKGRAPDGGYGVQVLDNAQVSIANCEIFDCWKEDPQPGEATIGVMVALPEEYEAMYGIVDERPSTVTMTGSTVSDNNGGICVYDDGEFTANCNNIAGNEFLGLYNVATEEVDATLNWWGDASGPSGEGPGSGDAVSSNVTFDPWLPMEFQYCWECREMAPVGGEAYPVNKLGILAPWIVFGVAIIAGLAMLARRRRAQS